MKYIIVGNSAAGIAAAESIRHIDGDGKITIISEETHHPYCRIFLPQLITGEKTINDILIRPEAFYEEKRIELITKKRVVHLDGENRVLHLDDGQVIKGDRILVATGGRPLLPSIEGIGLDGVLTARNYADALVLREKGMKAGRVVVVGAGFVALKIAEALHKIGLEVVIIKRSRFIRKMMDEEGSEMLEQAARRSGIKVQFATSVNKILGKGSVEGVLLEGDEVIACDMVVMAMGVNPRLDLVKNSAIETEDGIIVDEFMETKVPGIFAAGDVAQVYDPCSGTKEVNALWPNAVYEGKCAGFNMAGLRRPYAGGTAKNTGTFFGLGVASAGWVTNLNPGDDVSVKRWGSNYCKTVFRENKHIGSILIGQIDKGGFWANTIDVGRTQSGAWSNLGEGTYSMGQILSQHGKNEKHLAFKRRR